MNRGVEKRSIVVNDADRKRFVNDLQMLNDDARVENLQYVLNNDRERAKAKHERLVTIHSWCLMRNHYHMLLSDNTKDGVSRFLQKFNIGYTMYFNKKYIRVGALFQGKTKRVQIETDRQYLYILPYIHLNPLDFMKGARTWRAQCLTNQEGALKWVADYRWSSYRNYAGEKEFSEILEGSELYADREHHTSELKRFLKVVPDPTLANLNLE